MSEETISVAAGAQFAVRLGATPATGYVWQVAPAPAGLQLLGSALAPVAGAVAPGDPAQQVLRWRALAPGRYTLHFTLKRRWEDAPVDSHTAIVNVA
jgi:predicted secreted protein